MGRSSESTRVVPFPLFRDPADAESQPRLRQGPFKAASPLAETVVPPPPRNPSQPYLRQASPASPINDAPDPTPENLVRSWGPGKPHIPALDAAGRVPRVGDRISVRGSAMEEGYRASVILVQRVMGVVADGSIVLANVAISVVDHSGTLQRHPFGTVTLSHQGETYVMDAKEKIAKKWLLASGIITGKRPGYP